MAEVATAQNVSDQEVNFDHLIADLDERVSAQTPMTEAKTDYDQVCKKQNENRGYNKKAMNWLTGLNKMSMEKFEDTVGTLMPGLNALVEHRRQGAPGLPLEDNVASFAKPE